MSKVKPDAVVVELSRDRINSLYPMADSKSLGWKTSDSWVRKLSSVRSLLGPSSKASFAPALVASDRSVRCDARNAPSSFLFLVRHLFLLASCYY